MKILKPILIIIAVIVVLIVLFLGYYGLFTKMTVTEKALDSFWMV